MPRCSPPLLAGAAGLVWVAGGGPAAGRGTGTVTAYDGADPDFRTTGALVAGALYVVNGRVSVAGPTTENVVTRLPLR